jgi:hypothetical protein
MRASPCGDACTGPPDEQLHDAKCSATSTALSARPQRLVRTNRRWERSHGRRSSSRGRTTRTPPSQREWFRRQPSKLPRRRELTAPPHPVSISPTTRRATAIGVRKIRVRPTATSRRWIRTRDTSTAPSSAIQRPVPGLEEKPVPTRGDIFHGTLDLDQVRTPRPMLVCGAHRGAVESPHLRGSRAHSDGADVNSGHNAARENFATARPDVSCPNSRARARCR